MANNDGFGHDKPLVRYPPALYNFPDAEHGFKDSFTLYHLIQEENGRNSSPSGNPALPALGHAFAGSIATASAKTLLYPLDLIITRLQVQRQLRAKGETESAAKDADKEYSGLLDAAQKIYRTEGGVGTFYRGCATDVTKGIFDSFLFFLSYTFLRQAELKRSGAKNVPIGRELGIGVLAGSFAKFFTTPIQNIVTRQQTAALVAAREPDNQDGSENLSILQIAQQIHSERGLIGFWAGYSESVVLTINPAITFAVDNIFTRLLPESQRKKPSPQVRFLIAALSKAIATTITYPAMLAKSRAQVAGGFGDEEDEVLEESVKLGEKSETDSKARARRVVKKLLTLFKAQYAILTALRRIYRQEGLQGLYSGLEAEVLKGFLSHGTTMMVKERAQVLVIQTYYLLLRATGNWQGELKKAQESAKQLAAEARERAENVGETVVEGGRSLVDKVGGNGE